MLFMVTAWEAPKVKYGCLWSETFDSYEQALFKAAEFMIAEASSFDGGEGSTSVEYLAELFDLDVESKLNAESYLQWLQRTVDSSFTDLDIPDPNTGIELELVNAESRHTMHVWEGTTVFHAVRGLCTRWCYVTGA